ncbi:MAG: hypothetical protein Q8Q73_05965 [Stagnimonas sp.]|nr:hypothetical protein [Stagnimonas sp.]
MPHLELPRFAPSQVFRPPAKNTRSPQASLIRKTQHVYTTASTPSAGSTAERIRNCGCNLVSRKLGVATRTADPKQPPMDLTARHEWQLVRNEMLAMLQTHGAVSKNPKAVLADLESY